MTPQMVDINIPGKVFVSENRDMQGIAMAFLHAQFSDDPSTQVGAYIDFGDRDIGRGAHNCFPHDVAMTDERWERPLKYSYIEHAERNVIFVCARLGIPTDGATIYVTQSPCADCARAVVQAGFKRLVHLPIGPHSSWAESVMLGVVIMHEGGVEAVEYEGSLEDFPSLRRNGEEWNAPRGHDSGRRP